MPLAWKKVAFKGLKARGNFTVSAAYEDGKITDCTIESVVGGEARVRVGDAEVSVLATSTAQRVQVRREGGVIAWDTEKGETYRLSGFAPVEKSVVAESASGAWTEDGVLLRWTPCAGRYTIYRAEENSPTYTCIGETAETEFIDTQYTSKKKARLTYKVVAAKSPDPTCDGALIPMHPASRLEEERYCYLFRQLNLHDPFC